MLNQMQQITGKKQTNDNNTEQVDHLQKIQSQMQAQLLLQESNQKARNKTEYGNINVTD